ncbi:MAG: molybdopterin biosynthesis protein [Chloroflexota bacterium]|nr:MAG: molybdopterin biosynthesis protein [Chloroflexota bacterium]
MYLEDIPLPEAIEKLENALTGANLWGVLGEETLPVDETCLGRILAKPVWARISSPHYHSAAMDGFAVLAQTTAGAMATHPTTLLVGESAVYVDTGDPIPESTDAVIPIEDVEALDAENQPAGVPRQPHAIRIRAAATPWMHIRPMGEDMIASQLVLPAGQRLRPVDLGVIAASGNTEVTVARRPRVAIIPTGSELVPIGQTIFPGEIIEFNSLVLAGQIIEWGGEASRFSITKDDYQTLCETVRRAALDHDLVLINAGSSAGSEDFTARVVEELGELFVHGVAVRPGHPVILGMLRTGRRLDGQDSGVTSERRIPVIGIPGYPVSTALTGELFVQPILAHWTGIRVPRSEKVQAILTRKITSPAGDDDFVRVAVGKVGDRILAAPLARGAGVLTSLVRADGLALIPRGSQGLPAGSTMEVKLYRSKEEIERTVFASGSHDITMDILAQFYSQYGIRLVAANVGSIAGLVALSRREAHLSGAHLLDPETGEYNLPYIEEYLPDVAVRVISLVGRSQGLLVRKGNPQRISSLQDLTREDITFVNRQRGAGTRILLDYHLQQLGISGDAIRGYKYQEYTHLAVGVAVASGRADCGLGIAAVTKSLELDFIPLVEERYDLIIPEDFIDLPSIQPLFEILSDPNFRKMVADLPGYDISRMGERITNQTG